MDRFIHNGIVWRDSTSYSQSDKIRTPKSWVCSIGEVDIYITCAHIHYQPGWAFSCKALNIPAQWLHASTREEAADESFNFVRSYIERLYTPFQINIAAPKKEDESEDHLWYFVFQTYGGEFYHAAPRDEAAIISRIKREIEIKRKPI